MNAVNPGDCRSGNRGIDDRIRTGGAERPPLRHRAPGRLWKSWLRRSFAVVAAAMTILGLLTVAGEGQTLGAALHDISSPSWPGLAAAVAAEACVYLSYAAAQRSLLRHGGHHITYRHLLAVGLASQGIASVLPGGGAASGLFSYRLLRRLGLDSGRALAVLTVTVVLFAGTLIGLSLLAAGAVGGGGQINGLRIVAVAGLLGLAAVTVMLTRWARRSAQSTGDLQEGSITWFPTRLVIREKWPQVREQIVSSHRQWAPAAVWFSISWIADFGCLALSFYAVHARPPWWGLPLAYVAGQVAALLPLTPGGVGVVEGSLAVALTAFGSTEATSVAVVLVYRIISFWALLPVSAVAYLGLRKRPTRDDHVKAHQP